MFEHAVDGVQQLPHGSDQGLHFGFAARQQVLIESTQVGFMLHGDQRGHVEGSTQMFIAGLTDADFFMHGSPRGVFTRIEAGVGDPLAVAYTYDQTACLGLSVSCYNKGPRTTMSDASGSTQWAYDAMGRVLRGHRTIGSVTKDVTYTYNLDGSLASITYPSGRLVTYAPSAVGRALSATDTTHNVTYVSSAHYAPQGDLSSALFGQSGSINYSVSFDNRLRPSQIYAHAAADFLKLDFGYFANNNVQTITNDLTPARTLNFTYDNLNRLVTAQTQATSGTYCWGQSIPTDGTGYDRWGNLLKINVSQCTAPTLNVSVNTYNQITNSGFSYDNAGDLSADGASSYTWNGAGLLKTVGATTYTYDGDGKRVMNSAGTYFWPTLSGDQLSDTPGAGAGNEYIFFAGRRIAWVDSSSNVRYYWGDHLGSTRVVTDDSGNVCYDADYYPFQGERAYVTTCAPAYRFAGMKFDQESGDYYTLNRYYPPNLGRWLSPDPLAGSVFDPQSLNRYAYVLNSPTNLIDPLGLQGGPPPHLPACTTMECAWQYYGGSLYFGYIGYTNTCTIDGVKGPCASVLASLQNGSAVLCLNSDCTVRVNGDSIEKWVPPHGPPQDVYPGYWETVSAVAGPGSSWWGTGTIGPLPPPPQRNRPPHISYFKSVLYRIGCWGAVEPGLISPNESSAQDSTHGPEATEQQKTWYGFDKQGNQNAPLNPKGAYSPVPDTVANGVWFFSRVAGCMATVWNWNE